MGAPYRVLIVIVVVLVVAALGTVFRPSPWVSLFCIENDRLARPRSDNVFSMRLPSETIPQRKDSTSHASELSGVVDSMGGSRKYFVGLCNRSYIIPELYDVFAAHSVEWAILGKEDPWWSVISADEFKGQVDLPEEKKMRFYAGGKVHRDLILQDVAANGSRPLNNSSISVLDFGCGVGRLGMAFARKFSDVTCVDQSVFHLEIAKKEWQIQRESMDPETPGQLHLKVSGPDVLAAVAGKRFDFVYSMIVFQHMISPLQVVYLEQLCDILKPGGQGWVHIPTMIPEGVALRPCDVELSMSRGGIQMYHTPKHFLEETFRSRGCNVTVLTDRGSLHINPGYTAGFIFFNK